MTPDNLINSNNNSTNKYFEWTKLGGQIIVSAFFIIILSYSIYNVFSYIEDGYILDDNKEKVDVYTRAKDIFMTLFPLFLSLAGFWLGFQTQNKQVKKLNEKVDKSNAGEKQATEKYHNEKSKVVQAKGLIEIIEDENKRAATFNTSQSKIISNLSNNFISEKDKYRLSNNPYHSDMDKHIQRIKTILSS